MGEVNLGNLYDINKNLMNQIKSLSEEETNKEIEKIKPYFSMKHFGNKYFMMLCHERRDYTVFKINQSYNLLGEELKLCLANRGKILSISENENNAIEIWLNIANENFAYFIFPYDEGVIEC